MVGIAYAGAVCVGDSLGLGTVSRLAVGLIGGARGLYLYKSSVVSGLESPALGKTLAFTLGASTALAASLTGNVLFGATMGAGLGLLTGLKPHISR